MKLPSNPKLIARNSIPTLTQELSSTKSSIVFTNGCFDIIHVGHVHYLQQAKDLGHKLWIGLNSDTSIKSIKGDSRPLNAEQQRAFVLAGLTCVDYITIFSEDTPINLINTIQPAIHVKGGDYNKKDLPEYPVVTGYGGEVVILPFVEGFSTTSIIDQLHQS